MDVTLKDYHNYAMSKSKYGSGEPIDYPLFGLCGEVGELANKWKKVYRDNEGILDESTRLAMLDELGDCLWYVSALSRDLGSDLEQVAEKNAEKITARHATGTWQGSGDGREKKILEERNTVIHPPVGPQYLFTANECYIGKPHDVKLPINGEIYINNNIEH